MEMKSVHAELNKYKSNWRTQADVNSTISNLVKKIKHLKKLRDKELKTANTLDEVKSIRTNRGNEIKFYDFLLYSIKLDYYEIIGNL
ncbi:hypothetical protein [Yersinia phage fHe-Yen9-04]|uniref:Uncharacterized protein n=2 Tax=Eneladusvirus Yen904 TaxID=2560849 RepID=A0A2C9CY69_9CAUD|nr:hypothetical protein FDJ41_gp389 [Yersinia phage fHe-Yen9-04]SOK58791.1 hypothetical protein [Yersinia phage fHe-Yen9-04]SOK59329.1 hypothetical protein [Yersinia phage fHe-Yen9-03]VUE36560.1 hypothetical protein [Yersinia phage fHe-Yen9-04]